MDIKHWQGINPILTIKITIKLQKYNYHAIELHEFSTWLQLYREEPSKAQAKPVTWYIYPQNTQTSTFKCSKRKNNMKKLTTWSWASYEPALSNLLLDMSHIHISKDPDPLPVAKSIWCKDWAGTQSERTEIGTVLIVITY